MHRLADRADLVLRLARDLSDGAVGEADVLRLEHEARRQGFFLELVLDGRDVLDLVEEPLVDLRDRMDLVDRRNAAAQCLGDDEDALVVDAREVLLDAGIVHSSILSMCRRCTPISSERTALRMAPSKWRSMLMTSPVAFICVPSVRSA